jgi:hypothetical protein
MKSPEYGAADLRGAISPWRKRLVLKTTVRWAAWGLSAGLGTAAALLVAARFVPWPDAFLWCAAATVAGTAAGSVYSLLRTPSLEAAARQADRLLGLSDRLGTAWELRNSDSPFATLQRQDALSLTRGRGPAEAVHIRPGRRHFLPILAGLVLIGLLVALPNPMDRVVQQRDQFQRQLAQAGKEIQKTREEAAGPGSSLSAEERAAVEGALDKLEEALGEAETTPEALAALSEAEQEINLLREPKIGQDKQLRDVGATLAALPTTQALGQGLQSMDEAALRGAIEDLAKQIDSMSEGEFQDLAAALQRAANVTAGNEALAGSLRQSARAIASGDPETASETMGDLANRLTALQQGVQGLEALERTQADLRGARSSISGVALVEAGVDKPNGGDRQNGGGSGLGPGQAGNGGNGEGTGEGVPGTGGGSGLGPGGGTGGSGAGNQSGARQGEETGRLLTEGETVFIPGHGPGVPTEVRAGPGQGIVPGRLRPYNEVLGEYAEQAREHMERSPVPQGYKDLVRRYFAELEQ